MAKERFLPVLRELARCYQAFELHSGRHIRSLGLTPAQFDIIATLGNTQGMSCGELGEKTLITKGTLTGVIDRLEDKALVVREIALHDRRSVFVKLTPTGEQMFAAIFPDHLAYIRQGFTDFSDTELQDIHAKLIRLRQAFDQKEPN
ncbi:MarR family transcriptional regulator [Chitinivorax sp. B]|uniref:MarR family winged helix-turn-helix transcriptional regulator n=1 Tax=Chitinivorax sp. B TaxID=2502235 RepID=UPI0010F687D9|nr:MarR family transcriptional regulator [Chitinivorax sp. B]